MLRVHFKLLVVINPLRPKTFFLNYFFLNFIIWNGIFFSNLIIICFPAWFQPVVKNNMWNIDELFGNGFKQKYL